MSQSASKYFFYYVFQIDIPSKSLYNVPLPLCFHRNPCRRCGRIECSIISGHVLSLHLTFPQSDRDSHSIPTCHPTFPCQLEVRQSHVAGSGQWAVIGSRLCLFQVTSFKHWCTMLGICPPLHWWHRRPCVEKGGQWCVDKCWTTFATSGKQRQYEWGICQFHGVNTSTEANFMLSMCCLWTQIWEEMPTVGQCKLMQAALVWHWRGKWAHGTTRMIVLQINRYYMSDKQAFVFWATKFRLLETKPD